MFKRIALAMAAVSCMTMTPVLASETDATAPPQMIKVDGTPVNCNAIPIQKLSSNDIANVKAACDALDGESKGSDSEFEMKPEDIREWGALAKEFGTAVGATARELGIAVNEFLVTPAGVLITIYLFWSKLGGIVIGVPFLILIWMMFWYIITHFRRQPRKEEFHPVLFGLFTRRVVTEYEYNDPDQVMAAACCIGVAALAISAVVISTVIL